MTENHFILATAGHVDHGKSALVKALTGTDPDRLPEEKARGITIDLGFAHLQLSAPPTFSVQPSNFSVGIVDVPGHEDFVRNMIAGVGSIDLALLAVAADDGWMPQTQEHVEILIYLGVKRIVVALTKSDLGDIDGVTEQIVDHLKGTPFVGCAIIPTSIRSGDGLEKLKQTLALEFANAAEPQNIGKPRLFIDRAFTLRGIGPVVTGTLADGEIQRGQTVVILPRSLSTRVRSIQSHGQDVDFAQPATRTAMNLPEVKIDSDVQRGDVVANVSYEPTCALDVLLDRSPRLQRPAAIKSGFSAYVHHGTTRVLAKVIFAETKSLAVGKSVVAQLRLSEPLLAFVGDRIILRDASEQNTLAGGVVLNVDSIGFQSSQARALLASRAVAPDDVHLAVWTEVARSELILEPSRLLERSRFSAAEIVTALVRLRDHGELFLSDKVGARMVVWRDLRKRAAQLIENAHRAHPERRGLELNDLRAELKLDSPTVFDALVLDLCQSQFVRSGSTIAKGSHRAELPPELKDAAEKIRATLAAKAFDPPARASIAGKNEAALRFLIDTGEVVEVATEVVLLRNSLEQMKSRVVEFLSKNSSATVSQLREALQSSRRVVVPFLEYLDRSGVTKRAGDLRALRDASAVARL